MRNIHDGAPECHVGIGTPRLLQWWDESAAMPETTTADTRLRVLIVEDDPAQRTGLTQLVPDVGRDPDYLPFSPRTRSELAVPLRRNGRTLGVLNLESADPGALGAEEVRLAESLAEAISLGRLIYSSRAYAMA
jgi:GAF domain-containing protein